jgi:hypothetical protein
MVAASAGEEAADRGCPVSQPYETLELKLTDAQIAAIRLRVQRRKSEIAQLERTVRHRHLAIGVVELGAIDSEPEENLMTRCEESLVEFSRACVHCEDDFC